MPPVVASLVHGRMGLGAAGAEPLDHDDVLDGRTVFERLVRVPLERYDSAAPIPAVRRDQYLAMRVVDAVAERFRRETAEDDGVDRPDARARQHRDRRFRNQRQIDGDAIAACDAELLQDVGDLLDLDVEIPVRHGAAVPGLTLPDQRRLVATRRIDVSVDAVVRDVERSAHEPRGVRCFPLAHGLPALEPVQLLRLLRPERIGILRGARVDRAVIHQGAAPKVVARRKPPVFLEDDVDFIHCL